MSTPSPAEAALHNEVERLRARVAELEREPRGQLAESIEALRESEAVLRSLFDSPEVMRGIVELVDGVIVHVSCNATAAKMFGVDRALVAGKPAIALGASDEVAQKWVVLYEESQRTGKPVSMEYPRRDADGRDRWLLATASYLGQGRSGNPRFAFTILDLTDRKRADEALRESEERFRAQVMASSDVVYRMNPDWSEMRQLHGRSFIADTEAPSRAWLQKYIHPDDQPCVLAAIDEAIRTKSIFELEHRVLRVDSTLGWMFSRAIPLLDANGEIVEWLGAASDITQRRQAEEVLNHQRQLLEVTLQSIGDAVLATDAGGRITFLNPVAARLTGWAEEEALGQPARDVLRTVDEQTRESGEDMLARVLREGCVVSMANHTVLVARDGREIPIEDSAAPIRDSAGNVLGVVLVFHDVTEKRRAHRELQNVLDSISDGLSVVDRNWRYTYFNEQGARIIGVRREDMIGGCMWELFPQAVGTKFYEGYHRAMETGQPVVLEEYYPEPMNKWLECHCYPSETGLSVYFQDVTERRRAEDALRQSEEQFRTLANAIPQLSWMANADGWIFWYNQRWYEYTGTTPEQMEGWGWQSVHDPAMLPQVLERWRASIATGEPFDMVFPLRGADAVFRPFLTRVMPVRDREGKVVRWFGTNTDIGEQRAIEEALRESESRLRTLSDNLPEGAIFRYRLDAHGEARVDFISAGIERLTGVPAAEFMADAATVYRNILPEDHDLLTAAIAFSRERLEQFEVEVRHPHRITGEIRWSLLRSTATRNPDGSMVWDGIELDITERRRTEAKLAERTIQLERTAADLEERNREVERVNRMKTEFLSRVSHELRTPLNAIVGYSELLAEQPAGPLPPPYPRFVANIQEGARHLLAMVNDLLDISRIEAGHIDLNRESFRPADVLEEVLSVIAPLASIKRIPIENTIAAGIWIRADRTRFKQVLFNLLSNAVKFTPENGRVWIADASREDAAGFCVGDTGIGIPASELESVFAEFHQVGSPANVAREGTGLGLAITRRLVELHGGTIIVESTVGQGSRFTFWLGAHSLEHLPC